MRIVVTLDSQRTELEISPDATSARWEGGSVPVKVIRATGRVAELEVGGERVLVEGWPEYLPDTPPDIVVNGETFRLALERRGGSPVPTAPAATPAAAPSTPPPSAVTPGPGVAVTPPMPGRVVELRVHEGERVVAGQVLLVVEAMKMRNEVTSPAAGVVRALTVTAGSNVRAREPMLRVAPE